MTDVSMQKYWFLNMYLLTQFICQIVLKTDARCLSVFNCLPGMTQPYAGMCLRPGLRRPISDVTAPAAGSDVISAVCDVTTATVDWRRAGRRRVTGGR